MQFELLETSCNSVEDLKSYVPQKREGRDWFNLRIELGIGEQEKPGIDYFTIYWCSKEWWEIQEFYKKSTISTRYNIITESYDFNLFISIVDDFLNRLSVMPSDTAFLKLRGFAMWENENEWYLFD